jgi:hypothetical protein
VTTTTDTDYETDDDGDALYIPDIKLVRTLATRVRKEHGKSARLTEVASHLDTWPETKDLDIGQQEILAEEIVDELAVRDNGRRR